MAEMKFESKSVTWKKEPMINPDVNKSTKSMDPIGRQ